MKLYELIIDDGQNIYKTLAAAKNRKELINVYGGNGEFVKVKDVTDEYLILSYDALGGNSLTKLEESLIRTGWGDGERALILALVEDHLRKRKQRH